MEILGVDCIPLRYELSLGALLLSVAAVAFISAVAAHKTPSLMKPYRKPLIDSLVSCWLFSAFTMLVLSLYFSHADGAIAFHSTSVLCVFLPKLPMKALMSVYGLVIINTLRSTIHPFKHRFESVCLGSMEWYFRLKDPVVIALFVCAVCVTLYTMLTAYCDFFGLTSLAISTTTIVLSVDWLFPMGVLSSCYVCLFAFYMVSTNRRLASRLEMSQAVSRKTATAQMKAFRMLQVQFAATMFVGTTAILIVALAGFFPNDSTVFCANVSSFVVFHGYGTFYSLVVLATTRPYLVYTCQLALRCCGLESKTSFRTSAMFTIDPNFDFTKSRVSIVN